VTEEQMHNMYFDPIKFVDDVNIYILLSQAKPRPTSRLIKGDKQPEVFVYNGVRKFYIPDEETALLLFGPDWGLEVEEITIKALKAINSGGDIPSMKV
jgi:hypothetical protein